MQLDAEVVNALKDSLRNAPCNWCGDAVELVGMRKGDKGIVKGVIRCSKCDRINPATFKPDK